MTSAAHPPRGIEVSIVIPTLDRPGLLRSAIRSATSQESVRTEIVVVDDGSSTPLPAIEGVNVVRNGRRQGMAAARNRGIEAATGAWVAFLDDDDLWSPGKLRRQLDRAGDADFVFSSVIVAAATLEPIWIEAAPDPSALPMSLRRWNVIPAGASNVMVRRSVLADTGGFDEDLVHLADWDLWLRLATAHPAARDPETTVLYRQHATNHIATDSGLARADLRRIEAKHAALPMSVDRAHFARWIAHGHRRAGRRGRAAMEFLSGTRPAAARGFARRRARVAAPPETPAWVRLAGELERAERAIGEAPGRSPDPRSG